VEGQHTLRRVACLGLRDVQVSPRTRSSFCLGSSVAHRRLEGLIELLDQHEFNRSFAHEASHQRPGTRSAPGRRRAIEALSSSRCSRTGAGARITTEIKRTRCGQSARPFDLIPRPQERAPARLEHCRRECHGRAT